VVAAGFLARRASHCKTCTPKPSVPNRQQNRVSGTPALLGICQAVTHARYPVSCSSLLKAFRRCYFDAFLGDLLVRVLSNSCADGGGGTALLNTMALALTSLP
jgi:hypothetical protein